MTQNNPSKEVKARKPKGSINWLQLGKDKDPEFGQCYFLSLKLQGDKREYQVGFLAQIRHGKEGKVYAFYIGDEDTESTSVTHYAIITPPVE